MKISLLLSIALLAVVLIISGCSASAKYDGFAQCLSESGAKMFGAYWCPHCQQQKADFGKSWEYVDYIECSLPRRAGQTAVCTQAGIESYPTWEFADGSRRNGKLSLNELALATGCSLN